MITILDEQDIAVSNASIQFCSAPRVITLVDVDEHALLDYYFARGKQRVVIDFGAVRVRGKIDTRWEGRRRRWFVRTDKPMIVPASLEGSAPEASIAATRSLAIA